MEKIKNEEVKLKDQAKRFSVNFTKMEKDEEKILNDLFSKVNDKDFGKKIDWVDIAKFAMIKLSENEAHIKELQESSMSVDDILNIEYKKFLEKNPDQNISYKKFLLLKVSGKKSLDKIQ